MEKGSLQLGHNILHQESLKNNNSVYDNSLID
jgi:hypothetical protein